MKEEYQKVYDIGSRALKSKGDHKFVMREFKKVAARLRSSCKDLANNRATEFSQELKDKEALLKRYNKITGESIYG